MNRDAAIRASIQKRTHQAHVESGRFDFVREGEALATFIRQATPGTTYWRCYIPARYLPGQVMPMEADSLSEHEDGSISVKNAKGALVWQFLGDDGRSRVALQMQRQGTPTFMEVDDNYLRFAPPLYGKFGAWTKTHAEAMENGTGYSVEMHRKVVPLMDGIVCATENLADEYSEWNDNVRVARNAVDPTDWEALPEREESDVLRIGYYGSPSHVKDWPLAKKALKWAGRQPDVEVVMIGFTPPGWTGAVFPWEDQLFAARAHLTKIDVGIAPLKRNSWADGKSDVKAMEYAMAGVMPIVQDAPPYSPWVESGWDFCPSTEDEWMDVIQHVVKNRECVKPAAAAAKDYVLRERTIEQEIVAWREALGVT